MSNFSNYLEEKLLGATLCGSAWTCPDTLFLALATSLATDGDVFTEVADDTAYVRQTVVFGAPADSQCKNDGAVTYPEATTPWGTVTHAGIYDSPTGGNQLYWGALSVGRDVQYGDTFQFPSENFTVTLD